jgi:hypothetical protein
MKSSIMRTVIITSLATAVAVSALAMYVGPKMTASSPATVTPAVYTGDQQSFPSAGATVYAPQPAAQAAVTQPAAAPATPRLRKRSAAHYRNDDPSYASSTTPSAPEPAYSAANNTPQRDASGEPVAKGRSTAKSALIVAGSAGTGAAIGALAGGGKGAAIGALAGGGAGLIYDRITAHKQ